MSSLVSIVTPSFNQRCFVEQTLQSVLEQDYPSTEYIVMDGGSDDGSVEVIQRYASRLAYWRSQPDGGQAAAIAQGFARAQGQIHAYINSDDLYLPGALRAVSDFFRAHPDVELVAGNTLIIDANENILGVRWAVPVTLGELLHEGTPFCQVGCFWRASAARRAGGFDPSFRFCMDYDFFVRLLETGARMAVIDRYLAAYRVHREAKSSTIRPVSLQERERIRSRYPSPPASKVERLKTQVRWRMLLRARRKQAGILLRGGPWKCWNRPGLMSVEEFIRRHGP
ncbi:MAG: glycosyltransferase family 2 protein [bacterium]